jgi:hypothetical protein
MFLVLVMWVLILSACQAAPAPATEGVATVHPTDPPAATNTPAPTNTSAATNTALPTETPFPTATLLPAGVLFRDDFAGELQPGWEWENENPERWSMTEDGWLKIIGDSDSLIGQSRQSNLLWYSLPEGDFVITAHLKTKPFENFHQSAIFIYEDPENYVTINRGYCDLCLAGGNAFYMDYKIGGQWGSYRNAATAEDVYLRLESKGNTISGYYATVPDQWKRLGRFGNYFQFKKVGIGVSKAGAGNAVIGLFDYFEITLPD